jgi:transposase InsO family protein
VPVVTTDRGLQFTLEVWSALCTRLGVKHQKTMVYHPQANGLVERFHRQLKDVLRTRLARADWLSHLPWVLLGLRAVPKEDSQVSSVELVLGTPLVLPGELLGGPVASVQDLLDGMRSETVLFQPLLRSRAALSSAQQGEVPAALQAAFQVYICVARPNSLLLGAEVPGSVPGAGKAAKVLHAGGWVRDRGCLRG